MFPRSLLRRVTCVTCVTTSSISFITKTAKRSISSSRYNFSNAQSGVEEYLKGKQLYDLYLRESKKSNDIVQSSKESFEQVKQEVKSIVNKNRNERKSFKQNSADVVDASGIEVTQTKFTIEDIRNSSGRFYLHINLHINL